jgi:hypothetical protein
VLDLRPLLAIAARRPPSGPPLLTCAILTTEAVRPVHGRMPLILPPEHYAAWPDRSLTDPAGLKQLLRPYPADLMEALPLAPFVNSANERQPRVPDAGLSPRKAILSQGRHARPLPAGCLTSAAPAIRPGPGQSLAGR